MMNPDNTERNLLHGSRGGTQFLSPLIVATLNMYNRRLSDAAPLINGNPDKIDVLCLQEISSVKENVLVELIGSRVRVWKHVN
jgi:hypothetical protein